MRFEKYFHVIFRGGIGSNTREFFKHLSYVTIGSGVSIALVFFFNVFGGRVLGPVAYGEFTIVSSLALFFVLPMLLGIDMAIMKYGADYEREGKFPILFFTSFLLISIFSIVWGGIFLLISPFLQSLISLPSSFVSYAIIFALTYGIYNFVLSALRGMKHWVGFVSIRILYGLILASIFVFLIFREKVESSLAFLLPMFMGYAGAALFGLFLVLRKGKNKLLFDPHVAGRIMRYGFFATLSAFAMAVYGMADKVILNQYLGMEDVGIYRAYWFFSLNVVLTLFGIFNSVFFPTVSGLQDRRAVLGKIQSFSPVLFLVGVPGLFSILYFALFLFGKEYPFYASWAILFSITSIVFFLYEVYVWLLISTGVRGMKRGALLSGIFVVVNVGLNLVLIPLFGVIGAILANLLSFLFALALLIFTLPRYIHD